MSVGFLLASLMKTLVPRLFILVGLTALRRVTFIDAALATKARQKMFEDKKVNVLNRVSMGSMSQCPDLSPIR